MAKPGLVAAIKSCEDDVREYVITCGHGRALWVRPEPSEWSAAGRAAAEAAGYVICGGRDGDYVRAPEDAPELVEDDE